MKYVKKENRFWEWWPLHTKISCKNLQFQARLEAVILSKENQKKRGKTKNESNKRYSTATPSQPLTTNAVRRQPFCLEMQTGSENWMLQTIQLPFFKISRYYTSISGRILNNYKLADHKGAGILEVGKERRLAKTISGIYWENEMKASLLNSNETILTF